VNALNDKRVSDYMNENFVCTYLKVGTFQIINGQKVGGNVASYFCLADGSVLHAVPGQTNADKLLNEARWAYEIRKFALTQSTQLASGGVDKRKYAESIRRSHTERYHGGHGAHWNNPQMQPLPNSLPRHVNAQSQVHWLLARSPLANIDSVYPTVWTEILREQLSARPVERR
jgi:hypothetical protein